MSTTGLARVQPAVELRDRRRLVAGRFEFRLNLEIAARALDLADGAVLGFR